ncbi:polysaccharide biosynthesis/export family protein [Manganibacter manganicus]|uniref:Polysaccharide biosynthesis protein GumB n=1 Tax=Manganibacter manganicus TaxID=1873176 RepID=A0A1V8RWN4_9HYPH|nr:polysaccharide biosynthesis/export family protein [Pseudaminobacter manganicus]OQM77588.1 polysaccharide biosynthesis protein GumB [Pseudaminobacter manganicus]
MTKALSSVLPALVACLWLLAGCTSTANTGAAPSDVLSLRSGATSTADGSLRLVKTLPPPLGTEGGTEQLLSPNDVLEISVFQAESLNKTVQVDASGRISLPLIGVVQAAGKSVRQLEQELEKAYGKSYLQSPDITVFLKDSAGQRVTIDGEVRKAGLYPVTAGTTLLDAIALAGGFRDIADQNKVYVYRDVGGRKLVANYSVEKIRSGRLVNPRIYGGDTVMVFTSESRVAINNLKEALGVAVNASRLAVIP